MRVIGLDRAVWDIVCVVPSNVADDVLQRHGLAATGVQFVDGGELALDLARQLAPHGEQCFLPGGPVSNALHAMAACQWPGSRVLDLVWSGVTAGCDHALEPLESPLDSLRRVGIGILSTARAKRHPRTLCVVEARTASTRAIVVERTNLDGTIPTAWSASDVLLLALRDLLQAGPSLREQIEQAPAIALLVGDGAPLDETGFKTLTLLARSGGLRWLFGRWSEFLDQSIVVGSRPIDELSMVELVATSGDRPVAVWPGDARGLSWLDVPRAPVTGDDLGAGDAYAGAYLHHRLLGGSLAVAHEAALERTRLVLGTRGARAAPGDDLNELFAAAIDRRSSSRVEGRLFRRVRHAAGLVVISGGQTGIDQLGLRAAARLGLPSFCVLPLGRRTEAADRSPDAPLGPPDQFGDAHVEELGTPSYRYRTWTTAYLGDGTLLWDRYDSEGSVETRRACRALGRPCLEVTGLDEGKSWKRVRSWIEEHAIRVVNIAGNRGSLLTAEEVRRTQGQMFRILRSAAFRERRSVPLGSTDGDGGLPGGRGGELTVGIPNTPAHRGLLAAFAREAYGLELPRDRRLTVVPCGHRLRFAFARPRDLPALLGEGVVDLILAGSDLLRPGPSGARIVLDTGLFPLLLVLVGRPGDIRPGGLAHQLEGRRIGSQDVPLARHLLEAVGYGGRIRAIHGAAETWIQCGALDLAVDTWRTGATAQANGLGLLHVFGETSLVVAVSASSPAVSGTDGDSAAGAFVASFAAWLAGD